MSAPILAWSFILSNSAGVSGPGLFRSVLRNCKFTHVMKEGGGLDRLNQGNVFDAEMPRESDGVLLDSANVAVCDLVLRVDCHRQRFDSRNV